MRLLIHVNNVGRMFTRSFSTEKPPVWPRQIFSAIQPSGRAHLGNYLGAIQKWKHFQDSEKNTVIYAIADLHAITLPKDPNELHSNICLMAATLLACGIDTSKSILFQQSAVSEHTELCWILGTMSTMARLAHLPQYKEKSQMVKEIPVGIFMYPVLQAADIMLYRATHIPVGEDQLQQIELAQHLIKIFNNRFGNTFPQTETIIDSSSGRVKNLLDPTKKMSKSDPNTKTMIYLTDTPDEILRKVKRAITDFTSAVTYEPTDRPGVANLITIHSALTGKTPAEIVEESKNLDTGKYKLVLAEVVIEHLKPIRTKILEYMNSPEYLIGELELGCEKAREIAGKTMAEVKRKMGFDLLNFKEKIPQSWKAELEMR